MSTGERRLAARALNNWAWLLATCPETSLRNPEDAVKYARRSLEMEPKDGLDLEHPGRGLLPPRGLGRWR